MKKAHYLAGDMKREFLSGHFILAVAGTVVTLLFIAKTQVRFPQDILYIYDGVTMTRMALLVLVFGTIPYGICFCEDFEHKYIYISVIRGDIKRYVWSKLLAVFISAFAAMALGKLLFFLIMRLEYPWVLPDNSYYQSLLADVRYGSIIRYSPVLYFLEGIVRESLLGGVLAVCTAYGSLFFKNRLFVYTFPVMIYYFWINYIELWLGLPHQTTICYIFGSFYQIWSREWLDFLYALAVGILLAGLSGFLMHKKITEEIRRV